MPTRRSGAKVTVGTTPTRTLQQDVFVAQLLHQLRNTHHGYELESPKKRELLAVHTGHISQAFPELVVLYVVAMLSQPDLVLRGDWF